MAAVAVAAVAWFAVTRVQSMRDALPVVTAPAGGAPRPAESVVPDSLGAPTAATNSSRADSAAGALVPALRPGDTAQAVSPLLTTPPADDDNIDVGPWTQMRATTWVNIRSAPNPRAGVVGQLNPRDQAELGVSRGGWRRVRVGALRGWVDRRNFMAR